MLYVYVMDSKNYSFFEELVKTSHKEEKKCESFCARMPSEDRD